MDAIDAVSGNPVRAIVPTMGKEPATQANARHASSSAGMKCYPEPRRPMKVAALFSDNATGLAAAAALSGQGIEVTTHHGVGSLLSIVRTHRPDALVLQGNGDNVSDWFAMLAFHGEDAGPVVVLGNGALRDMCEAFSRGAADYAVASEGMEIFVRRVQAQIYLHGQQFQPTSLRLNGYALDARSQTITTNTGEIKLTGREFALAWVLFEHAGRVVSLNTLSARIWGRSGDVGKRTIEQHVYKLRRKLEREPVSGAGAAPIRIRTVHNVGYRLDQGEHRPC